MSDHYVEVEVHLEQMKSFGDEAEKQGVDAEAQLLLPSSLPASVSLDSCTIATADREASSNTYKNRSKSRNKPGKDEKNSSGLSLHSSAHEQALQVRETGKMQLGKSETNGNYVNIHPSKNIQEDGSKLGRKRRPVTVDTSKAKTSLEALKISIKHLKWKEVCWIEFHFAVNIHVFILFGQ